MFGKLARKIGERFEHLKNYRTMIDREKLMLDPGKIVLQADFFEFAVKPVADRQDRFSSLFGEGGEILNRVMHARVMQRNIPVFMLPLKAIEESRREEFKTKVHEDLEQARETMQKSRVAIEQLLEALSGKTLNANAAAIVIPQVLSDEEALANVRFPALKIQDIADSMDLFRGPPLDTRRGIERYETGSLLAGEGALALEFWKNVNSLRDYSGFFPNRPPPKDNDRHDPGTKIPVIGLRPAPYSMAIAFGMWFRDLGESFYL